MIDLRLCFRGTTYYIIFFLVFGIDIEKKRKWVTTRKVGLLVFDISLIGDSLCTLLVLWVPTSSFFVSLFLILLIYYYYYTFSSSPHPNNNKQATKFSLAYKCFFLVREFLFFFIFISFWVQLVGILTLRVRILTRNLLICAWCSCKGWTWTHCVGI